MVKGLEGGEPTVPPPKTYCSPQAMSLVLLSFSVDVRGK